MFFRKSACADTVVVCLGLKESGHAFLQVFIFFYSRAHLFKFFIKEVALKIRCAKFYDDKTAAINEPK